MERYHHGELRDELLHLGLTALETTSADKISLRSLAESAGVSKTAPYRHFPDKEIFMAALADEGFRLLYLDLVGPAIMSSIQAMGNAYMDFALRHPALYRLMTSPVSCKIPEDPVPWARRTLILLAESLVQQQGKTTDNIDLDELDVNSVAAAWGYIHGIVLIRIDNLFPNDLTEPDWNLLIAAFLNFRQSD